MDEENETSKLVLISVFLFFIGAVVIASMLPNESEKPITTQQRYCRIIQNHSIHEMPCELVNDKLAIVDLRGKK